MFILLLLGVHRVLLAELSGSSAKRTCDQSQFKNLPFCDISLDHETRVKNFISHISEADILGQFGNTVPAMSSVGVPAYEY